MRPPLAPNFIREERGLGRARSEFWGMLGIRIALTGGVYPILVLAGWLGFWLMASFFHALATGGWHSEGVWFVLSILMSAPFIAFQVFVTGSMWTGIVSLFFVPVIAYLRRLLDWPAHLDVAGKLTGSLIAYLATLPAALIGAYHSTEINSLAPALIIFAHCSLAIAMGQAAGCLAAVADLRRRRRGRLASSSLRFGVWQLLALTVPVALVLSLLKFIDMLNPPMALASIAAAFCAVASWQPVTWLVNRYLDRRRAKRRRRRLADCSTWNNLPLTASGGSTASNPQGSTR